MTANQPDRKGASPAWAARSLARLSDRYVVDRLLGRGGMGVVYVARDVRLGRPVALKVLHPEVADRMGAQRFLGEIRLTAGLQHPNILPVLDSGCEENALFSITPLVSGGSLRAFLEAKGRLSGPDAIGIALEVLDALEYAHAQGIVHCDLKPENILLSNGHAMLSDFGIARIIGSRRAAVANGEVSGSPEYMSPEQASGEEHLDGRSDLFSLGCVLYELVSGTPAFTGSSTEAIIARRFTDPIPRLDAVGLGLPLDLKAAITTALANDPDDRFQTARAFARTLSAVNQTRARTWAGAGRAARLRPKAGRFVRNALLVALLLATA